MRWCFAILALRWIFPFCSPHCTGCAQNCEDSLAETRSAIYVSMCDINIANVVVAQHGTPVCCSWRVDLYASSDQTYRSFSLGWPTFNVYHIYCRMRHPAQIEEESFNAIFVAGSEIGALSHIDPSGWLIWNYNIIVNCAPYQSINDWAASWAHRQVQGLINSNHKINS